MFRMQTIIDLVNEIRWSPEREPGEYSLGYYDRVAKELRWIRFGDIVFEESDKFAVLVRDPDGRERHIPYHRFRRVKCGEEVVWEREMEEGG